MSINSRRWIRQADIECTNGKCNIDGDQRQASAGVEVGDCYEVLLRADLIIWGLVCIRNSFCYAQLEIICGGKAGGSVAYFPYL